MSAIIKLVCVFIGSLDSVFFVSYTHAVLCELVCVWVYVYR